VSKLYHRAIYNEKKFFQIRSQIRDNNKNFEKYLKIAINSEKNKKISASWEPLYEIEIKPLVNCLEIKEENFLEFSFDLKWYELKNKNEESVEKIKSYYVIYIFNNEEATINEKFSKENLKLINGNIFICPKDMPSENLNYILIDGNSYTLKEEISNISIYQENKEIEIIEKNFLKDENIYKVYYKGNIDKSLPIDVNGIKIENWKDSKFFVKELNLENGKKLLFHKENNLFYINNKDLNITQNTKIYSEGKKVNFKIKKNNPKFLKYKDEKIELLYEENSIFTFSRTNNPNEDWEDIDNNKFNYNILYKNSSKSIWIKIKDEEDSSEDSSIIYSEKSSSDIFFEEFVEDLEDNNNNTVKKRFKILKKNNEERRLLIESKEKNTNLSHEELPKKIFISINTYNLEKQKHSILELFNKPLKEHAPLLALVDEKSKVSWKINPKEKVKKWFVLTDENRSGTNSQRNFVEKAISTEDFCLLEGPPGSGKTTAIMELILQLIEKNKKVLLSASTHVAIDNVIERLKDKNLLSKIFPIRIGDKNNLSDSVREFHIDKITEANIKYSDLIMESSNLVCGTTIGLLQHPMIKNAINKSAPIVPIFDYLIIDESSKTTFQEFLVPALYAKKWILVGDIKQLSPFVDQENIINNFNDIVSKNIQKANLILFHFFHKNKFNDSFNYCIIEKDEIIEEILKELKLLKVKDNNKIKEKIELTSFLIKRNKENNSEDIPIITLEDCQNGNKKSWRLYGSKIIFVKESEYNFIQEYIPSNMLLLNHKNFLKEAQHFRANYYYMGNNKKIKEKIEKKNKDLKDKKWAEEITWRIIRQYELRSTKNNNYEKDINLLIPQKNPDYKNKISIIKNIALPSILETLKEGVGKRKEKSLSTVLNEGFEDKDLKCRYECLDYQHRMHPDISSFPRKQFYNEKALKDAENLDRYWTYERYRNRTVWIDVKSKIKNKNKSEEEVKILIEELEIFLNWAKNNKKNNNEKWIVACLTFYRGQERLIRKELQKFPNCTNKISQFEKNGIKVVLYTVDKFQGREADITFLSMVKNDKIGFLNSPNRLNVALTRARYQRIIIGNKTFFENQNFSDELKNFAKNEPNFEG
jgi:superfamily I DNA and/or RNA helicase